MSWSRRNNSFPPGCAVVLKTTGALPEHSTHFFLFLFPSWSPFFCVLCPTPRLLVGIQVIFPLLWSSPSHLLLSLLCSWATWVMRAAWLRCNCSLAIKELLRPAQSHTVMLRMPAQMPAESRTPFHLSLLKNFFVGVPSQIVSWDRVHFSPFVLLFFLHPVEGVESWNQ